MNIIKQLRQEVGLTQAELATEVDVSVRTVQAWEQGQRSVRHIRIDTLEALAKVLGCDIARLIKEGK